MRTRLFVLFAGAALLGTRAAAQTQLASFDGAGTANYLGQSVAFVGDLNGDGYDDFAVGASGANAGTLINCGVVALYSGKDHTLIRVLAGTQTPEQFGWSVAGPGDVNGDGIGDIAVGVEQYVSPLYVGCGAVRLFDGATGALLSNVDGTQTEEGLGFSVDGAGDWDGDGVPDIVTGTPFYADPGPPVHTYAGLGEVLSGNGLGTIKAYVGTAASNEFGYSVSGAGDVDGGGVPDIVVGVPSADTTVTAGGRVRVISGETKSLVFGISGTVLSGMLGYAVDGGGDINDDGFTDVIAGQFDNSGLGGVVRTYLGPTGTAAQLHMGVGSDHLGSTVASVGDVDKDGFDDLAGGAIQNFGNGYFDVWSGKTGGVLYQTVSGQAVGDWFGGSALAGGGDANADGWPDLLVGADHHAGPGGTDSGRAYLYDAVIHQTNLGFQGPGIAKADAYGGPLSTGTSFDIWLTQAKPSAPAWLILSAAQLPAAFKGGTLVPNVATGLILSEFIGPDGRLALANLPGGHGPLDVYLQFVIKDPGQIHGFALSNAVKLHLLP